MWDRFCTMILHCGPVPKNRQQLKNDHKKYSTPQIRLLPGGRLCWSCAPHGTVRRRHQPVKPGQRFCLLWGLCAASELTCTHGVPRCTDRRGASCRISGGDEMRRDCEGHLAHNMFFGTGTGTESQMFVVALCRGWWLLSVSVDVLQCVGLAWQGGPLASPSSTVQSLFSVQYVVIPPCSPASCARADTPDRRAPSCAACWPAPCFFSACGEPPTRPCSNHSGWVRVTGIGEGDALVMMILLAGSQTTLQETCSLVADRSRCRLPARPRRPAWVSHEL